MRCAVLLVMAALSSVGTCTPSRADDAAPLVLEAKIPLGEVRGRIDHMAIDPVRQRLFVAELGNDSVGVVDLKAGKVLRRIVGLSEPQGVGYVPSTDTLYVADARDGSVRLFQGSDLAPTGRIDLGDDADNIRVDVEANKVFIGYGGGALAVIDAINRGKVADIALKAHPEGFQLDAAGGRIFVNLPDARQIAIINGAAGRVSGALPLKEARSNFPMALDRDNNNLLIVTRAPPKLVAFGLADLLSRPTVETCGDADDVFVDSRRHRIYVSCGEGFVDVFQTRGGRYERLDRVSTVSRARTSFFASMLDRLFLAVRATGSEPASIWVFRPRP
jgi:hypothetical protein